MIKTSRVDFNLIKGSESAKTFLVTEIVNGKEQPYDLSSKTIEVAINNLDGTLLTTLNGAGGLGSVEVIFGSSVTTDEKTYTYSIKEINGTTHTVLIYGDLDVGPINLNSLDDIIAQEYPGIVLPESFKETKVRYWQLFLQNAPSPAISNENLHNSTEWPELFNHLISKLVNLDYLTAISKVAIVSGIASENSSESGGLVKKIETGPTNVEFYDLGGTLGDLFRPNTNGDTALYKLSQDICELADRLKVQLGLCKPRKNTIVPHKVGRADRASVQEILTKYYSN